MTNDRLLPTQAAGLRYDFTSMSSLLKDVRPTISRVSVGVPRQASTIHLRTEAAEVRVGFEYLNFTLPPSSTFSRPSPPKSPQTQQFQAFHDLSLLSVFLLDTRVLLLTTPIALSAEPTRYVPSLLQPLLTNPVRMKQQLAPVLGRLVLFQLRTSFANTRCSVLIYNQPLRFTPPTAYRNSG
jgi:hypothetical protein